MFWYAFIDGPLFWGGCSLSTKKSELIMYVCTVINIESSLHSVVTSNSHGLAIDRALCSWVSYFSTRIAVRTWLPQAKQPQQTRRGRRRYEKILWFLVGTRTRRKQIRRATVCELSTTWRGSRGPYMPQKNTANTKKKKHDDVKVSSYGKNLVRFFWWGTSDEEKQINNISTVRRHHHARNAKKKTPPPK